MEKLHFFLFYFFYSFIGRGATWQCGRETETTGGPAGGEEPGAAQSEKDGRSAVVL